MKEKNHLPIFGIGPFLVAGLALTAVIAIVVFCYIFRIGTLSGLPALLMHIIGMILVIAGIMIWFIGAMRSGMDDHIKRNQLKTDGIYAWVRNPMYSGCWMLITGVSLMWRNAFLIPIIFIKATPHKARLTAWRHICLHLFRHLAQKFLAGRQPSGVISIQSDEKSGCASAPPALCGVA